MGLHDLFGHLQHKLWLKERPGVKLTIWLSTTESQELTRFPCVQVACDTPLESSQRGLQLRFKPHPNLGMHKKLWTRKVVRVPTLAISDTIPMWRCTLYYMGEGGGFPRVRAVLSLVSPRLPMVRPSTKGVPTCVNQLVCWFCAGLCEWVKLFVTFPSPILEL